MTSIFRPPFRRTLLLLSLCFLASLGARAQITELVNSTTARVHFYLRFTDQAQIRNVSLRYSINGTSYTVSNSDAIERIADRDYFTLTIDAPYDATNHCLQYPIVIGKDGLTWRERLVSTRKKNSNEARFYGDAFIFVQQYYSRLTELTRFDYIYIDEEMEQRMMYEYDLTTGLSTRMAENNGVCTWELNTQDFRHVGNKNYDMSTYPYHTETVLARKAAFKNWQYTVPALSETHGDLVKQFGTEANLRGDDVFHACADGGNTAAVTFGTLRADDEQAWPTGCTATRSFIIQADPTSTSDIGLVGHVRITLKPLANKWKAESWVQLDNPHADGWATFSTPYDVVIPSGLLVLAVTTLVDGDNTRINMVTMGDYPYIPAGNGVVVKGTGTFRFLPVPTGADMTAASTAYTGSGNNMQYVPLASINALPYESGGVPHYILTYDDDNNAAQFVRVAQNTPVGDEWDDTPTAGHIQPFKSYLRVGGVGGGGSAKLYGVVCDASDVVAAPTAESIGAPATLYDLQGRRHSAAGALPRGIYIMDGKKYVKR